MLYPYSYPINDLVSNQQINAIFSNDISVTEIRISNQFFHIKQLSIQRTGELALRKVWSVPLCDLTYLLEWEDSFDFPGPLISLYCSKNPDLDFKFSPDEVMIQVNNKDICFTGLKVLEATDALFKKIFDRRFSWGSLNFQNEIEDPLYHLQKEYGKKEFEEIEALKKRIKKLICDYDNVPYIEKVGLRISGFSATGENTTVVFGKNNQTVVQSIDGGDYKEFRVVKPVYSTELKDGKPISSENSPEPGIEFNSAGSVLFYVRVSKFELLVNTNRGLKAFEIKNSYCCEVLDRFFNYCQSDYYHPVGFILGENEALEDNAYDALINMPKSSDL